MKKSYHNTHHPDAREKGLRQPRRRHIVPALALALALGLGKSHAAPAEPGPSRLHIASADWGNTRLDELAHVLAAVLKHFGRHFPDRHLDGLVVRPGQGGPSILYERDDNGAYVIKLSARDSRWFQFVYQFAHELCHIYSNFDNKVGDDGQRAQQNQWFEESICETASLYTLRSLARRWADAPPESLEARNAANLHAYADYFLNQSHRTLPATRTLAMWYRSNQHHLERNPYRRRDNEIVATILLPYFEKNPANWRAISYLNADAQHAAMAFEHYLDAWLEACPDELKQTVERIMVAFNLDPAQSAPPSNPH